MSTTHRPILRIGQHTTRPQLETTLKTADGEPVDLSSAAEVRITTEHERTGYVGAEDQAVEIVDGAAGEIRYQFAPTEVALDGRYRVQFAVEYDDGSTEMVPAGADQYDYIDVGRQLPREPLDAEFDRLIAHSLDAALLTDLDAAGHTVANLGDPFDLRDATPKEYVDDMAGENIEGMSNPATDDFDVNGYAIRNAAAVDTEQLQYALGDSGWSGRLSSRKLVSEQDRVITVGEDTNTIQEALNQIPLLLRHELRIEIPDGDYDEHIMVPPVILEDTAGYSPPGDSREGASQNPWITGNTTNPTNVKVNSITVVSAQGAVCPLVEGMNPTGQIPHDDDPAGVMAYGCQNVSFRHISHVNSSARYGYMAYSSAVKIREACNLGSNDIDYGVRAKHSAMVTIDSGPANEPIFGTVNEYVIYNFDGSIATYQDMDATGDKGIVWNYDGLVYDSEQRRYPPNEVGPVIDDFDRSQALDFMVIEGGAYQVTTDDSLVGDQSLAIGSDNLGYRTLATPYQVTRGHKYRLPVKFEQHDTQAAQGMQCAFSHSDVKTDNFNENDGYSVVADKEFESVLLLRYDAGSSTELGAVEGLSIPTDEWIAIEVELDFGQITGRLVGFDGTQYGSDISVVDQTYQGDFFFQLRGTSDSSDRKTFVDYITRRPL